MESVEIPRNLLYNFDDCKKTPLNIKKGTDGENAKTSICLTTHERNGL